MKTIPLFVALLVSPIPSILGAADGLGELAVAKRGVALKLTSTATSDPGGGNGYGAFISDDGLALVGLRNLALEQEPTVVAADGTPLEFGAILGIFPEHELALMKFEHRPKDWLRLAEKEPEVGEAIALVTLGKVDILDGKAPPVVGPVMAKRSGMTTNLLVPLFTKVLSLGSGLSPRQRASMGHGLFAVDRTGDLVAFTNGIQVARSQTLVLLAPVVSLAGQIDKLAKERQAIPFPLPKGRNLIDPTLLDRDFHGLISAVHRRDGDSGMRLLKALLERYPTSHVLKLHAATNPLLFNRANPLVGIEDFPEPNPDDPAAQQVAQRSARANYLITKRDYEGAIREWKAAIALSPKDFPENRASLARMYRQLGRLDEAERLFRETYPSFPEAIDFVRSFRLLCLRQLKFDAAETLSKWEDQLEEIYR